jgi:hypothetical protein
MKFYLPETQKSNETEWLIDVGAFFDRFGSIKLSILTSQDVVIKAILADINVRHYLDLKRPEVAESLAYIGTVIPELTAELQEQIVTVPVQEAENNVLRKLYFN